MNIEKKELKSRLSLKKRWYVVRSNNRQEKLAMLSITQAGLRCWLPLTVKTNQRGETYGMPFFPNHLFVQLSADMPEWPKIFSARGVSCVLGAGNRPSALADRVVEEWMGKEIDGFLLLNPIEAAPQTCRFKRGDRVVIKKGPWPEIEGVFQEQIDSRRVIVLLKLLGESHLIAKADLAHVELRAPSSDVTQPLAVL